jgi:hypothetical protein
MSINIQYKLYASTSIKNNKLNQQKSNLQPQVPLFSIHGFILDIEKDSS